MRPEQPDSEHGTTVDAAGAVNPAVPPHPYSREAARAGYHGPPPMTPPPFGWHPQQIVEVPPPRTLPAQDHAAIDDAEARARTVTYTVGAAAGALIVVLFCMIAGRLLF